MPELPWMPEFAVGSVYRFNGVTGEPADDRIFTLTSSTPEGLLCFRADSLEGTTKIGVSIDTFRLMLVHGIWERTS